MNGIYNTLTKTFNMLGIVGFKNYRLSCIIGVYPYERKHPQELSIDVCYEIDFALITLSDDLSKAVCYASLAEFCSQVAQEGAYQMLETLAHELVLKLADKFSLHWVKVMIRKEKAISLASCAFVELEYGNRLST
ncbi:putative dihydroneopterin aldolase [Neochlamydia sp. EPS4]|nr:putative dihydroneopterin aldolase [Neochlamydia sp. EPS4]